MKKYGQMESKSGWLTQFVLDSKILFSSCAANASKLQSRSISHKKLKPLAPLVYSRINKLKRMQDCSKSHYFIEAT